MKKKFFLKIILRLLPLDKNEICNELGKKFPNYDFHPVQKKVPHPDWKTNPNYGP